MDGFGRKDAVPQQVDYTQQPGSRIVSDDCRIDGRKEAKNGHSVLSCRQGDEMVKMEVDRSIWKWGLAVIRCSVVMALAGLTNSSIFLFLCAVCSK